MARITIFLVCFAILFQSFQRTWIVASWKINQSYIASTLCENRMEKKSCCAGSCYLNKQLKENEQKQETTPLNEKERVEYVTNLFDNAFSFYSFPTNKLSANFSILWSVGQPKTFIGSIFHPPSLLG